jgi:hypothetical protein
MATFLATFCLSICFYIFTQKRSIKSNFEQDSLAFFWIWPLLIHWAKGEILGYFLVKHFFTILPQKILSLDQDMLASFGLVTS